VEEWGEQSKEDKAKGCLFDGCLQSFGCALAALTPCLILLVPFVLG
jgi:hypothetical protein